MCIYKYWIFKKKNDDVQQFVTMSNGEGGGGKRSGHDDVPQKSKDFVIKGPYRITI